MKLDLLTGVKRAPVGLGKTYNETPAGLGQVEVSPDGKRLLWASSRNEKPIWVVARLDGSERTEWHRLKVGRLSSYDPFAWSDAFWTDNGKAVMETSFEPGGSQTNIHARLSIKRIEPSTAPKPLALVPWPSGTYLPSPSAVDHTVLLAVDDGFATQNRPNGDVGVVRARLSGAHSSVVQQIIHLPAYSNFFGAVPSPNMDRVAWGVGSPYDPTFQAQSGLGPAARDHLPLGYWVSRSDGSELRPVGHLPFDRRGPIWQYEHLGRLRWTPDGKRLSFVYDGVLYCIDAPYLETRNASSVAN